MTPYDLFSKYLPDLKPDREQQLVKCIFHNDDTPSLSVNIKEGVFHCFGCGAKGGIKEFLKRVGENEQDWVKYTENIIQENKDEEEIRYELALINAREIFEAAHKRLMQRKEWIEYLKTKGWNERIIQTLKIGFEEGKIVIPITRDDEYIGCIKHDKDGKPKYKLILYKEYKGTFPCKPLYDANYIFVVEGISDTVCLLSHRINAITPLVPNNPEKYLASFDFSKYQNIVICTDNDMAGELIRRKYNEFFRQKGIEVLNVYIPEYKDVSEFVQKKGKQAFVELVKATKEGKEIASEYQRVNFDDIFTADIVDRKVVFSAYVASKMMQTYVIPRKVKVNCPMGQLKCCKNCFFAASFPTTGVNEFQLEPREQIELIDESDDKLRTKIRKMLGIPNTCNAFEVEETDRKIAEMYEVVPLYRHGRHDVGFRPIPCISSSKDVEVKTSASCDIYGKVIKHPKNSQLIVVSDRVESIERKFFYDQKLDSMAKNAIGTDRKFDVMERLEFIAQDLARYTGIVGRDFEHLIFLLPFMSPYHANIDNEIMKLGFDLFVIGDTRTGKTTIFEKYVELFEVGTMMSAENMTFAGLVGGMQQLAIGKWTISWGIIPQNDRGIVILDEADEVKPELLSKLTSIRTTGYAEIVKVQQARASARVRFIMIANPKIGYMERYSHGIKAILDFGYSKQDISRFDMITTMSNDEVENPQYTPSKTQVPKGIYRHLCHRAFDMQYIKVPKEIIRICQNKASELSAMYVEDIPLFTDGYSYTKILRVAAAIANLLLIDINADCIDAACEIIRRNYSKPSCGLLQYSIETKKQEMIFDEQQLRSVIWGATQSSIGNTKADIKQLMRKIYMTEQITVRDIQEITGLSYKDIYDFFSKLVRLNALKRQGKFWIKTKGFREWLKKHIGE
jgi:5S rRNA maturation endonuclease (ribonuclease M5)